MNEEELAKGKKRAAQALVLLGGAFVMVFAVLATTQVWKDAWLGFHGESGQFVAATCESKSSGRSGANTVCTGTFTADNGSTVATSRLKSSGPGTMAVGDSHRVRCDTGGACAFEGTTDAAKGVGGALFVTLFTALIPVGTLLMARRIGSWPEPPRP
ncbi:hypothetical protein ACFC0K_37805 [Streptomyces hydrogenans]|uniref:hypothetical protein n=1 Tax=Streptomyces hydrogenans TaxID=1873719 RepID=UPI0035DAE84C